MRFTSVDQVNEAAIRELIENEVSETSYLEYKSAINFGNDSEKKELLADICSMSNSGGGLIIYGIEEKRESDKTTGLPDVVIGINDNSDEIIRKIDESSRHSIEPMVNGLKMKELLVDGKKLLILFIPKSQRIPHVVTYKGSFRFWKRANASKYQMNLDEIRSSFFEANEVKSRVLSFKHQRIEMVASNETPVILKSNPKIVIHIYPLEAMYESSRFDVSKLTSHERLNYKTLSGPCSSERINFDGFVTFVGNNIANRSYTQIFRNGVVEMVNASLIESEYPSNHLFMNDIEEKIITATDEIMGNLHKDGVSGSILIFISFLGVKGYEVPNEYNLPFFEKTPIDRDNILLPEIFIDEIQCFNSSNDLKSAFDMIWNACGYEKSPNYNDNGYCKKRANRGSY